MYPQTLTLCLLYCLPVLPATLVFGMVAGCLFLLIFASQRQIREKTLIHFPQSPEFKLKATGLVLLATMVFPIARQSCGKYHLLGSLLIVTNRLLDEIYCSNRYLPRQWRLSAGCCWKIRGLAG